MNSLDTQTLTAKLDYFNRNEMAYDLLGRIFIPFGNNLRDAYPMELYAHAIKSVYSHIQDFKQSHQLPAGTIRLPGLNDSNTYGIFFLLDGIGSLTSELFQAISFDETDIRALKEMLLIIQQNKLEQMRNDPKVLEN